MNLIKTTPEDIIRQQFQPVTRKGDTRFFSGFMASVRDARKATSRHLDTGKKKPGGHYGSWLGAIGYMTLLDQIGTCYKPKKKPCAKDKSIIRALTHFSTLNEKEREALYALRCCFAHDYSLTNVNHKKFLRQHRFKVCQGSSFVVQLPKVPWDGDYENATADNTTIVSLEGFGDLVENIISQLLDLANRNEIECVLAGGVDELLKRYSFYSKP